MGSHHIRKTRRPSHSLDGIVFGRLDTVDEYIGSVRFSPWRLDIPKVYTGMVTVSDCCQRNDNNEYSVDTRTPIALN